MKLSQPLSAEQWSLKSEILVVGGEAPDLFAWTRLCKFRFRFRFRPALGSTTGISALWAKRLMVPTAPTPPEA